VWEPPGETQTLGTWRLDGSGSDLCQFLRADIEGVVPSNGRANNCIFAVLSWWCFLALA